METEAIVEQIKSLLAELRAKGISEDMIDSLIGPGADYRVVVDSRGYLMLPDCKNMKIRLTPMERSLYILLLRYPEGIPVDDLYLYYDELLKIYLSQTVYDDMDAAQEAVGALVVHSGSMVSPLNKQIFSNNFRIFNILHTHFGNLDYALSCRFC